MNGSINILQFDKFKKFLMIWFITNSSRVPFHCVSFLLGMLLCQWYVEFRLCAVVHVHRDPSMQIWNRQPSLWQLFKGRGTLKPFPFQQFFYLLCLDKEKQICCTEKVFYLQEWLHQKILGTASKNTSYQTNSSMCKNYIRDSIVRATVLEWKWMVSRVISRVVNVMSSQLA